MLIARLAPAFSVGPWASGQPRMSRGVVPWRRSRCHQPTSARIPHTSRTRLRACAMVNSGNTRAGKTLGRSGGRATTQALPAPHYYRLSAFDRRHPSSLLILHESTRHMPFGTRLDLGGAVLETPRPHIHPAKPASCTARMSIRLPPSPTCAVLPARASLCNPSLACTDGLRGVSHHRSAPLPGCGP